MDWSLCVSRPALTARLWPLRREFLWQPVWRSRSCSSLTSGAVRIQFSPCGSFLASGEAEGGLRVWDVETGQCILSEDRVSASGAAVSALCWHSSAAYLWVGTADGSLSLLPLRFREAVRSLFKEERAFPPPSPLRPVCLFGAAHQRGVRGISCSKRGSNADSANHKVFSCGGDGSLKLFDVRQPSRAAVQVDGHSASANCVALSPEGSCLLSVGSDGLLRVWNSSSLRLLHSLSAVEAHSAAWVTWSEEGTHILCTRSASKIQQSYKSLFQSKSLETESGNVGAGRGAVFLQRLQTFYKDRLLARIWNVRLLGLAGKAEEAAEIGLAPQISNHASLGTHCQENAQDASGAEETELINDLDDRVDWALFENRTLDLMPPECYCAAQSSSFFLPTDASLQTGKVSDTPFAGVGPATASSEPREWGSPSLVAVSGQSAGFLDEDVFGELLPSGAFWRDRVLLPCVFNCESNHLRDNNLRDNNLRDNNLREEDPCSRLSATGGSVVGCYEAISGNVVQLLHSSYSPSSQTQRLWGAVSVHPDHSIGVAATSFLGQGGITLWMFTGCTWRDSLKLHSDRTGF